MRRWLQLGAVSAGVGAAVLLGPQSAVAAADTATESESAPSSDPPDKPAETNASDDDDTDEGDSDATTTTVGTAKSSSSRAESDSEPEAAESEPAPEADEATPPAVVRTVSRHDPHREAVADDIAAWTASSQSAIASLPVAEPVKELLNGGLVFVRRTFLNQAPVIAPVTFTSQSKGPITGQVGAVDPEGDRITYRVVQGPKSGTVQLNADGSYTYAPGADFDGVATFTVAAHDAGLHVNVLDLFRAPSTDAAMLVNQGAIEFAFNYTEGQQYWTPERRAALERSASAVLPYFMVENPVTLEYDVVGEEDSTSTVLAHTESDGINVVDAGFFPSVVENELLTGVDSNGAAADGHMMVNFAKPWTLGDSVGDGEYDFQSTVMHELLHSFGFASVVGGPGTNTYPNWGPYDSFLTTADGTKVICDDLTWDTTFDPNLTGGDGGLYFGGPNAVAAYGKPVPVYTPDPWSDSSSTGHLDGDTFTGADHKLMNPRTGTGPGVRVVSPIELAIFKDLGFIVVL